MLEASGELATTRGLKLTMYAMLLIAALKLAQIGLGWLATAVEFPIVAGYSLIAWVSILVLSPLMMVALLLAVGGSYLSFRGTIFVWAKRFAIGAMAAFTVALMVRAISWLLGWLPYETQFDLGILSPYSLGPKGTGMLMIAMGIYMYYLLALDAGDEFPGGLGMRGGRVLFVPLAPILVGGVILFAGEDFRFDMAGWAVLAAAGLTAFSIYNRIPPEPIMAEVKDSGAMPR